MIALAALVVAYQFTRPQSLYVKQADNAPILNAIATEVKAANQRLTPTPKPYKSPTPTPTDSPPTETPLPTYSADANGTPGLYLFEPPQIPPTPYVEDWPICADLAATPDPFSFSRTCEVK